jgi:hypothetical protein
MVAPPRRERAEIGLQKAKHIRPHELGKWLDFAKAAHHTSKVLPGEFMAFSAFS